MTIDPLRAAFVIGAVIAAIGSAAAMSRRPTWEHPARDVIAGVVALAVVTLALGWWAPAIVIRISDR